VNRMAPPSAPTAEMLTLLASATCWAFREPAAPPWPSAPARSTLKPGPLELGLYMPDSPSAPFFATVPTGFAPG